MIKTKNLVTHIVTHSNAKLETVIMMEECGEVIQELAHAIRTDRGLNHEHLAEEMAQLYVSWEVIRKYYSLTDDEIQDQIDRKYDKNFLTHRGET